MPDWNSLPLEIRGVILEYIITHDRIAKYSTVSEEWRCAVEEKTFHSISIRIDTPAAIASPFVVPDLHSLDSLRERQRGLIRHIWLNIALLRYECPDCYRTESTVVQSTNSSIMQRVIRDLFAILAGWEPTKKGLTLELNAYSPSDSDHWFQGWYFGAPDEREIREGDVQSIELERFLHFGRRHTVCEEGLRRPFATFDVVFSDLPVVRAVTKFLIRRQCRRQFSPSVLYYIWSKLPSMGHIMHETWRPWGDLCWYDWDESYGRVLCHETLPSSVKKITVFEDFNRQHQFLLKKYRMLNQIYSGIPLNPNQYTVRSAGRVLAGAFAKKSMQLEHLSVAFLIDAAHFFRACEPAWRWDELRSLTLTTKTLARETQPEKIHRLLRAAARAALSMPKLGTLTLWHGGAGEACAFVYRRYQDNASITWRANWEFELGSEVHSAWEAVAKMHSPRSALTVETEMLRGYAFLSHGDAIHYLDLHGVVDSMSLKQIRKESRLATSWLE